MRYLTSAGHWLQRRPALIDALKWSIPALIAGFAVRAWIFALFPYAFYGSDSHSYYQLASDLYFQGKWDFSEKRRWLYPLLVLPTFYLPGAPLVWIAIAQKLLGLVSIVPLVYAIRKTCRRWRLLAIPASLVFGLLPFNLASEQQATGHSVMIFCLVCALAGWISWRSAVDRQDPGASSRFWLFWIPFAAALLTKPVCWFLIPGLLIGLALQRGWRGLTPIHYAAVAVVLPAMAFMGGKSTKERHMLNTAFPLLRLDTPLHAKLKAEVASQVRYYRARIHIYYSLDEQEQKGIIENPDSRPDTYPEWARFGKKGDRHEERFRVYRDLSMEAFRSAPHLAAYIGLERSLQLLTRPLGTVDFSFAPGDSSPMGFDRVVVEDAEKRPHRTQTLLLLLNRPTEGKVPPLEALREQLYGGYHSPSIHALAWVIARLETLCGSGFRLFGPPAASNIPIWRFRPTLGGLLVLAGFVAACTADRRNTCAPWALAFASFVFTSCVFISGVAERQVTPLLPLIALFLALGTDFLLCGIRRLASHQRAR